MTLATQPSLHESASSSTAVSLLAYACHSPHEQTRVGFVEPGDRRIMAFMEPGLYEPEDTAWPTAVAKEGSD